MYPDSESEEVSLQSVDQTHNANIPKNIIPRSDVIKIERDSDRVLDMYNDTNRSKPDKYEKSLNSQI